MVEVFCWSMSVVCGTTADAADLGPARHFQIYLIGIVRFEFESNASQGPNL